MQPHLLTQEVIMATVRFSTELKDEVLKNAENTFALRLAAAEALPETPHYGNWADFAYNRAFGMYIDHINALPDEFFEPTPTLKIKEVSMGGNKLLLDVKFKGTKPLLMPFKLESTNCFKYHHDWARDTVSYRCDPTNVDDLYFFQVCTARRQNLDEITEQRKNFKDSVAKVMESFATLAPALKAWPPLWELIPDSYKQRHMEIKQREKSTESAINTLDLGSMTANVVLAKLIK
jgi:hypothetical protein